MPVPEPATRSAPGTRLRGEPARVRGGAARVRHLVERDIAVLRPGERPWLVAALEAAPGDPCPPLTFDTRADVVTVGGGWRPAAYRRSFQRSNASTAVGSVA